METLYKSVSKSSQKTGTSNIYLFASGMSNQLFSFIVWWPVLGSGKADALQQT